MNDSVRRKAPSPPVSVSQSAIDRKYLNSKHCQILRSYEENCNSVESTISQLIFKEQLYVQQLNILVNQMKIVAIESSRKLQILNTILTFHKHTLLGHLQAYSKPFEVYHIFSLFTNYFELYTEFAQNFNDFSYIVMDLSAVIIDNFKARILEYNFTMSNLKLAHCDNAEMVKCFTEIEVNFKNLFYEINCIMKNWELKQMINE